MVVPCLIACMAWWRRLFGAFQSRTPMWSNDNRYGSLIFFRSTIHNHSAPWIIWAHNRLSKNRFGKTSFHHQWYAAVSSSPSLQIPWKVSWVIYKILLSISLSRNKEGNYLVCRWVMSPPRWQGMNPIIKTCNIPKEPTGGQWNRQPRDLLAEHSRLDNRMLKQRHRWNSVLSEMGQGGLMGSICCTWIPFILVTINQSHLSPLLKSYSANPLEDPKIHFCTGINWIILCHDSHDPLCLPTGILYLVFFLVMITSYCTFISQSWRFCLTVSPTLFPLLTHSLLLSIWS